MSISENISAKFQIKIHMVAEKTSKNFIFIFQHPVQNTVTES